MGAMKRTTTTLLLAGAMAAIFLAGSWYGRHLAGGPLKPAFGLSGAADRQILYYVDPMHPAYTSDRPGIAPDCGMDLVPVYAGQHQSPAADSALAAAVSLS